MSLAISPCLLIFLILLMTTKSLKTESSKNFLSSGTFSSSTNGINFDIEHLISVTGKASKTVDTDIIYINLNVETLDMDLHNSYKFNSLASTKLDEVFRKLKIPEKNITTTSYSTDKKYRDSFVSYNSTWVKIFEGYKISNKMNVKLSDLKKASDLIDGALNAGPILITSINFDFSEENKKILKDQLLKLAAKDARDRGNSVTEPLRIEIDDVKTISVTEHSPFSYVRPNHEIAYSVAERAAPAPQLFSGKSVIDVSVQVNFLIMKE